MFIKIIVDRVGNTNVFNVIHDNSRHLPELQENHSLNSITDDDLIQEYLSELREISNISNSISKFHDHGENNDAMFYDHLDLNKRLHQIGETFFRQFFPSNLQKYLSGSEGDYVFFQIDPKLASIPLEILSTGKSFLWEKFYIGKSVKGQHGAFLDSPPKENLSMLIIADPTEDLEWARREGENLFDYLSTNFPEKKLQIELISGRKITKLSLLNSIVGKDLIHYSGHLHYTTDAQENGWILYNDKIIHAREIQQSGSNPLLIFSNSCVSGRDLELTDNPDSWYENFASSFLKSGQTNYIGSIWELPDNEQTLEFTLQFYDILFNGEPVGLSLQKSREYARKSFPMNDLTWASYLLMGNPMTRIFQSDTQVTDLLKNVLNHKMVLEKYPYPIAISFQEFLLADKKKSKSQTLSSKRRLEPLFLLFNNSIFFMASIIFANYNYLKLSTPLKFDSKNIEATVSSVYQALKIFQTLQVDPLVPKLLEVMYIYKDDIQKIIGWIKKYDQGKISDKNIDGYLISLQYLLERFLIDVEFIKNYGFYRIMESGYRQFSLFGLSEYHMTKEIVLPTQSGSEIRDELTVKTSHFIGRCVFYIPIKRVFLDLSPFLDITIQTGRDKSVKYDMSFNSGVSGSPPVKSSKGGLISDIPIPVKKELKT